MSGGSYDYLSIRTVDELVLRLEDIQRMADRLKKGYPDAGAATQAVADKVAELVTEVERLKEPLERIWHAAEWCDSADYGEEEVRRAVEDWRQRHKESRP